MHFIGTCADVTAGKRERLMKGAKRFSYKTLCLLIKEQFPELYESLALNFYNPWSTKTQHTATHYILVHSASEYFFRKV